LGILKGGQFARLFHLGVFVGMIRTLLFGLSICLPALLHSAPLTVDEAKAPIRVDGHLEDWPSARMVTFDKASQLVQGRGQWKGPQELSGKLFLTYDERHLYLAALVRKKDRVVNDKDLSSIWDGDGLELFFSTEAEGKGRSPGDYHLGFTPGTDCKDPRLYCFNKDKEVRGARVIARSTLEGYLLEASIPLDLFRGLDLGPGRSARLDLALNGGGFTGQRILRFDLAEAPQALERPDLWLPIRWLGGSVVKVPKAGSPGFSPGALEDGTKGATYAGIRDLKGRVLDPEGRPLAGAWVSTWPRTTQVRSDASGDFTLPGVKVYDKTLLYAWAQGHSTGIAVPPSGGPSLLRCHPLPFVQGNTLFGGAPGEAIDPTRSPGSGDPWGPLRIVPQEGWTDRDSLLKGMEALLLRAKGRPVLVEVPLDQVLAGELVRHLNVVLRAGVRYWSIGNAPDREELRKGRSEAQVLTDLINRYRTCFNAMKRVDPSIAVLGPGFEGRYRGEEGDWLTPFLIFNGDILDMVAFHRPGVPKGSEDPRVVLEDSLRGERSLLRSLKGKVAENTGRSLPLAVTSAWAWEERGSGNDLQGFLWAAQQGAMTAQEGLAMDLFTPPQGEDPSGWLPHLLGILSGLKGVALEARVSSRLPGLSFYPFQDPTTREVSLLLVNREDRACRLRVRLDGKPADLRVEAGMEREFDVEVLAHSANLLTLKAGEGQVRMLSYSGSSIEKGLGPDLQVLKAW